MVVRRKSRKTTVDTADVKMEDLIVSYFNSGYCYDEIVKFLNFHHGITISLRSLKRSIKHLGLKRKNCTQSSLENVCKAIFREIKGSGNCLGYKSMWRRLQQVYGLHVKRSVILRLLRIMDPEGINARKKRRLQRRKYVVPGPNFLWHIDGYDKLKPYGFAIHAAIDGFSRRILWLRVGSSNNNPKIIADYYLKAIEDLGIIPNLIRCDKGTENSTMGALHCFLRSKSVNDIYKIKGFIQGKSTSNQKIESYWSQLRRSGIDWWISYFKDLRDSGEFDNGDELQVECLRFCFGSLIQSELNLISTEWNCHRIRKQKNIELPTGKPNVLYFLPNLVNTKDCGKHFNENELNNLKCFTQQSVMYSPTTKKLLTIIKPNLTEPKSVNEALQLYREIIRMLQLYTYAP